MINDSLPIAVVAIYNLEELKQLLGIDEATEINSTDHIFDVNLAPEMYSYFMLDTNAPEYGTIIYIDRNLNMQIGLKLILEKYPSLVSKINWLPEELLEIQIQPSIDQLILKNHRDQ